MTVTQYIRRNLSKTIRFRREDDGTLLGLPEPYTVPCADEMFLEMYYWDTYFTNVGLLAAGMEKLAKSNTENLLYLADRYGFVPNGSRTYYLCRSQPPYLAHMAADVYEHFRDKDWLSRALPVLKKEYAFWMRERIGKDGLNVYGCLEEPEKFVSAAKSHAEGRLPWLRSKGKELETGRNIFAECESGWDFNGRFDLRCTNFYPVDLNSLLYGYERHFAAFERELGISDGSVWEDAAERRRELMRRFMRGRDGVWLDYDFVREKRSRVLSAASFWVYWMGVDAGEGVEKVYAALRSEYGVFASVPTAHACQWGYPNGWPPLNYAAAMAMRRAGREKESLEICRGYCRAVEKNFDKTGRLWEKYNAESGGTDTVNEYEMPPMFGWTAGVYLALKKVLDRSGIIG